MAVNVGRIDPAPSNPFGNFAQGINRGYQRYMGPKIAQGIRDRRQDERDMADFNSMVIYEKEEAANNATKARESGDVNAEMRAENKLMELDELSKREDVTPSNARIYVRNAQAGIDSNMRIGEGKAKSAVELEGLLEVQEKRLGAKETTAKIRADLDKDLMKQKNDSDVAVAKIRAKALTQSTLSNTHAETRIKNTEKHRKTMAKERRIKNDINLAKAISTLEDLYLDGDGESFFVKGINKFIKAANEQFKIYGSDKRVEKVKDGVYYTYKYVTKDGKDIKNTDAADIPGVEDDKEGTMIIDGEEFFAQ